MKKIFYVFSAFLVLAPGPILADYGIDEVTTFDQVNNCFFAGPILMHLNFIEDKRKNTPGPVENYGMSYGIILGFRKAFFDVVYSEISVEYTTGRLQYDGYKREKPYPQLSFKETHQFINTDVKLGGIVYSGRYFQIIPYGGFGFRYWSFDMGEDYRYHNFKAIIGAKLNFNPFDDLVLSSYVNFGTTFLGRAKAKVFETNKYLGKVNLHLGNRAIKEIGLELNYRLDREIFLFGLVSYNHFGFGKSDSQLGYSDPDSKTREMRYTIGIRYGFK